MTRTEMSRLRRRVCDDLELAIAAHAPSTIVESLATASGMLEALADVPRHELVVSTITRAQTALRAWDVWKVKRARKVTA